MVLTDVTRKGLLGVPKVASQMKAPDRMRLIAALVMAAAASYGLFQFGHGAAGWWILCALLSTLLFSSAGGPKRVRFTAIAVLPPFLINRTFELSYSWNLYRKTRPPFQALYEMLPNSLWATLAALGFFVAAPLTASLIVSRYRLET